MIEISQGNSPFEKNTIVTVLVSLLAGGFATLAFAPFDITSAVFVSQAIIFSLWTVLPPARAWLSGWLYGIALQCSGVGWIYYSLHVHGGTPPAFAILLIFLLSAYLGLFTGFAAYIVNRYCSKTPEIRLLFFYPAAWTGFEWLQGYALTGFAWMQTGYTQIDLPLSGYAPLLGNHGVSALVAVSAGAAALIARQIFFRLKKSPVYHPGLLLVPALVIFFLWTTGAFLKTVSWTQPQGGPVKVSIIQGNIPQAQKWRKAMHQPTLDLYKQLTLAQKEDIDLIIWPETAVPDFWFRVQPFVAEMKQAMQARHTDLIFGIFVKNEREQLLNSILNVNGEIYNKRHLVPLGEYIPLRFLVDFFNQWVKIPMSDIASGDTDQPLMKLAGVPVGLSICFEDAFARDILVALPESQFLVNVSNDAWFEDSHESYQHHAIARMRALETGRYMVRSTNTGISAIIGPDGRVIQQAPHFKQAVLTGQIQPYSGSTPYVIWGDNLILIICFLPLVFCVVRSYTRNKQLSAT